jgi:hypothetical protein
VCFGAHVLSVAADHEALVDQCSEERDAQAAREVVIACAGLAQGVCARAVAQ